MSKFLPVLHLSCLLISTLMFSSCILKPGRNLDRGREFQSPLQPLAQQNLDIRSIQQILNQRTRPVRNLTADLTLTAGGGLFGKQQFQATMFVESPSFLRIRGSKNEGNLFDLMLNRDAVQMVVYPQQSFYRGTLQQLQSNSALLGGLNPQDLVDHFAIEQTLVERMKQMQFPIENAPNHYILRFDFPTGVSERYYLRKQDLLVDRFERLYGGQTASSIRYWGYSYFGGSHLMPTQLTIELPAAGGEYSIGVSSVQVDEPRPPQVAQLDVPQGFERMAIGPY